MKVCVPWDLRGTSSWSSQHLLYSESLMETVSRGFPEALDRVYLIHKRHVVCVRQLHEPRDHTRCLLSININHSFMQCREDEVTWDLIKIDSEIRDNHEHSWHNQTLTVGDRIQACDCGRFGAGWAAPSSQ